MFLNSPACVLVCCVLKQARYQNSFHSSPVNTIKQVEQLLFSATVFYLTCCWIILLSYPAERSSSLINSLPRKPHSLKRRFSLLMMPSRFTLKLVFCFYSRLFDNSALSHVSRYWRHPYSQCTSSLSCLVKGWSSQYWVVLSNLLHLYQDCTWLDSFSFAPLDSPC